MDLGREVPGQVVDILQHRAALVSMELDSSQIITPAVLLFLHYSVISFSFL